MDTILFIGAPGKLLFSESFKNSFAKFNYKIVEPEYLKFSEQNFILKKIKSQRKKYLDDFFEKQNSLYINALKNNNIKFVFIVNNSRVTPHFCNIVNKIMSRYFHICMILYDGKIKD